MYAMETNNLSLKYHISNEEIRKRRCYRAQNENGAVEDMLLENPRWLKHKLQWRSSLNKRSIGRRQRRKDDASIREKAARGSVNVAGRNLYPGVDFRKLLEKKHTYSIVFINFRTSRGFLYFSIFIFHSCLPSFFFIF